MRCKTIARPLRIEFEGAFYRHITSRGNQRDRRVFDDIYDTDERLQ